MPDDMAHDAAETPVVLFRGKPYMVDAKGGLVPIEAVKPAHKLEDELVRKVVGYAQPLAAQIARFRQHTFDDVDAFVALLEQEYGARRGGSKGNLTFTSYDGLLRIQVAVADQVVFGPELQVAKGLVDECLAEWADGAGVEIRTIVTHAFNVDQANRVSRSALLALRRYDFTDPRWLKAMEAIREAERVVGSKRYVRIYRREAPTAPWAPVSIDAASA